MNLPIFSAACTALGEILVAYMVVSVHHRVMKEHKIDASVFRSMRREQIIVSIGVGLIILGFILNVIHHSA